MNMVTSVLQGQRAAVIGGSLGGLAAANILLQLGATVTVFEQHAKGFEQRGGGLGVSIPLFQDIRLTSVEVPRVLRGGGHFYGDAWQFLCDGLPAGTVQYGVTITNIYESGSNQPELEIVRPGSNSGTNDKEDDADSSIVSRKVFDVVVLADGGWSELRKYVLSPNDAENSNDVDEDKDGDDTRNRNRPDYAGYVLWRGLVETSKLPPSFDAWGGFRNGKFTSISYPIRCPKEGEESYANCGIYIAMPEEEVERPQSRANRMLGEAARVPQEDTRLDAPVAQGGKIPPWFLPLIRQLFGGVEDGIVDLYEACARHGKLNPHPVWEFMAPKVVRGRMVLLGDSAHMASPNTGAGAHTALLDARALRDAFLQAHRYAPNEKDRMIDLSLRIYNEDAVARAAELLKASKRVGLQYVPRGSVPRSPATLLKPGSLNGGDVEVFAVGS